MQKLLGEGELQVVVMCCWYGGWIGKQAGSFPFDSHYDGVEVQDRSGRQGFVRENDG